MRAILTLLLLAACAKPADPNPAAPAVLARCEGEADQDPVVRLLRMKGAGNELFLQEHQDDLRIARADALRGCLRGRGTGPRGGVERQRQEG